jgi:hypothetical protein
MTTSSSAKKGSIEPLGTPDIAASTMLGIPLQAEANCAQWLVAPTTARIMMVVVAATQQQQSG